MSQQNLTPKLIFLQLMVFTSILISSLPISTNSLTFDMVRRDSFDFDLFPTNLSDFQKNRIFAQLSHSRAHRLSGQLPIVPNSINGSVTIDSIQPPIKQFMDSLFAVSLGIGSTPYNTYLLIDTGSDVTWVQCKGCKNGPDDCFHIKNGPFNYTASASYHKISFKDQRCKPQIKVGHDCAFEAEYGSGHVMGVRAQESLQFRSAKGRLSTVSKMVIGCADFATWTVGHRNDGPNNVISGIFGLAIGDTAFGNSFLELTKEFTKMKFSYCLPSWTASKVKQIPLSSGDDVPHLPPSALSTPMDNSFYYLNVIDISVGGHRLNLNPSLFKRRGDGNSGFIIDSGSGVTFLVNAAYDKVRQALAAILESKDKHPVEPPPSYRTRFCYKWPLKINNPPSVTYHMENNADIEVRFEDIFYREKFPDTKKYLACMSFYYAGDRGMNILGAAHQADYRFVYDLNHKTLHFHRERC